MTQAEFNKEMAKSLESAISAIDQLSDQIVKLCDIIDSLVGAMEADNG